LFIFYIQDGKCGFKYSHIFLMETDLLKNYWQPSKTVYTVVKI